MHTTTTVLTFRWAACAANNTLLAGVRIEERHKGNDRVHGDQKRPFEVVAAPIKNKKVDDEGRREDRDSLEEIEVEAHVDAKAPAKEDDDWRYEQGDLRFQR